MTLRGRDRVTLKIALTGASGGIGKSLMATLGASHEMTGIVRTPRSDDARYVGYGDKPGLAAALAERRRADRFLGWLQRSGPLPHWNLFHRFSPFHRAVSS